MTLTNKSFAARKRFFICGNRAYLPHPIDIDNELPSPVTQTRQLAKCQSAFNCLNWFIKLPKKEWENARWVYGSSECLCGMWLGRENRRSIEWNLWCKHLSRRNMIRIPESIMLWVSCGSFSEGFCALTRESSLFSLRRLSRRWVSNFVMSRAFGFEMDASQIYIH